MGQKYRDPHVIAGNGVGELEIVEELNRGGRKIRRTDQALAVEFPGLCRWTMRRVKATRHARMPS